MQSYGVATGPSGNLLLDERSTIMVKAGRTRLGHAAHAVRADTVAAVLDLLCDQMDAGAGESLPAVLRRVLAERADQAELIASLKLGDEGGREADRPPGPDDSRKTCFVCGHRQLVQTGTCSTCSVCGTPQGGCS